jgi:hypothetical protein
MAFRSRSNRGVAPIDVRWLAVGRSPIAHQKAKPRKKGRSPMECSELTGRAEPHRRPPEEGHVYSTTAVPGSALRRRAMCPS